MEAAVGLHSVFGWRVLECRERCAHRVAFRCVGPRRSQCRGLAFDAEAQIDDVEDVALGADLDGSDREGRRAGEGEYIGTAPLERLHQALGPQQRHEMLVRAEFAEGLAHEHQSALRQLGLLDQQLLAGGFLLIGPDEAFAGEHPLCAVAAAKGIVPQLRPALFSLLDQSAHESQLSAAQLLLSVGVRERLLCALLLPGDSVAIEDPCFLSSINMLRYAGFSPSPVPVDGEGMQPEALEEALRNGARAVIITPRAHNPTGVSMSRDRARSLAGILATAPSGRATIAAPNTAKDASSDVVSFPVGKNRVGKTRTAAVA